MDVIGEWLFYKMSVVSVWFGRIDQPIELK
jgi:hypothetical protein